MYTCEQLAILLMGSPMLGHHATSRTQSVCESSFSSNTQLSPSSLGKERGEGGGSKEREKGEYVRIVFNNDCKML